MAKITSNLVNVYFHEAALDPPKQLLSNGDSLKNTNDSDPVTVLA